MESSRLEELWNLQKEFNEKFWSVRGGIPRGDELLTLHTKDFAIHLIVEISEVLNELNYKMHRATAKQVDKNNIMEELIDCQKFLWGMMQLWGFECSEFYDEFKRKSMVVEQRFAQEQQFSVLKHQPVVIIDIDGILNNYPVCFYDWLSENYLKPMSSYQAGNHFKSASLRDQQAIKRIYRQSGAKRNLPIQDGAKDLLDFLKKTKEVSIVLLTNRPYEDHYRIYPDTLEWLSKNDLKYDAILWARDKGIEAVKYFDNIYWAVDDSLDNIQKLSRAGVATIHLDPFDPLKNTRSFVKFLNEQYRDGHSVSKSGYDWNERKI